MNCKVECLKLNPELRCMKHRGTCNYSIVIGEQGFHKPYSNMFDTLTLAWKDCYNKISHKHIWKVSAYLGRFKCDCGKYRDEVKL